MTAVTVRPMVPDHLPEVLAIEQAVQPQPWTEGLFLAELAEPTRAYRVALDPSGTVLGFGGILVAVDEMHVTTLATSADHLRRGIASHLMVELMDEALARGATAATLEVRTENHAAQRLYARFGFAPVGVRPGYYAATGEDALIMWAHDIDGADAARRLDGLRVASATARTATLEGAR
ncbi:Ribosomal-protein-S18p-alanine acetyltransferase [Euzebya pacifica]|uniref:Ribosomal-protein-S18p-alanine acetyltransferase n=1 Tax=Euzebya pacifica TaxID=1608957 RepID=A0A346XT95_9ACTN|nr:Ribosomal-protein-S18p-alanine acetyltransferase [Euzebya pacifica]